MMQITSPEFNQNTKDALGNYNLQTALKGMEGGLAAKRRVAVDALPEYQELREYAKQLKDHTLANLDAYILQFEENAIAAGAKVHWASTADEARDIILELAKTSGVKFVTKGKSMASEEIGLNHALEAANIRVLETDLGEYIIQLRHEAPSHIIAPAIHVLQNEVESLFRENHPNLKSERNLSTGQSLVQEARTILRHQYGEAIMGITGANFLIAESGQSVIVTNEGNGDLTQHSGKIHVVIAGIDKIIPTLEDTSTILRLLARSATGQELSSYTTFSHGAKQEEDADGPQEYHLILLDNGRSTMLGNEFRDMLRCIRCAACMNVCPVYRSIGGHAYGWVYPGPMGAVLTPNFIGLEKSTDLPNASTLCGRCAEVCPVKIPLPDLLRTWRVKAHEQALSPATQRYGLWLWAMLASNPSLYQKFSQFANWGLRLLTPKNKGFLTSIPFGLANGWCKYRRLASPSNKSFMALYRENKHYEP